MKFLTIMALGFAFAITSFSASADQVICERHMWSMDGNETGNSFVKRLHLDHVEANKQGQYELWKNDTIKMAKELLVLDCQKFHSAARCQAFITCRVEADPVAPSQGIQDGEGAR